MDATDFQAFAGIFAMGLIVVAVVGYGIGSFISRFCQSYQNDYTERVERLRREGGE